MVNGAGGERAGAGEDRKRTKIEDRREDSPFFSLHRRVHPPPSTTKRNPSLYLTKHKKSFVQQATQTRQPNFHKQKEPPPPKESSAAS